MKRLRQLFFWTHLTAGLLGGFVIFVMSITGVVLALRPQIQNWVDRDVRYVAAEGQRLSPHALLTAVAAAQPGASIQQVSYDRDATVAPMVNLGRDGNVYVDPYTGAVRGGQSRTTSDFFQSMVSWHRYMNLSGESRATGRAFTGASNLAFLFLGLTGLYIWWPKALSAKYLRPIVWFKSASTGKARDFNWHNTIGFWCLIPIVIMTASGAVISYPWASNLVYRVTGSPLPNAGGRGGGPGGPGGGGEGRGGQAPTARAEGAGTPAERREGQPPQERRAGGGQGAEGLRGEAPRAESPRGGGPGQQGGPTVIPAALDAVFARAEQQVPTWEQLSFRLPNREGGPVQFTLMDGAQWNNFARSQLTLNGTTADVLQWQPYEQQSLGQKARGWLRFAHTGELGGVAGQVIAGIGCLGGVFLVYTGVALAWRRFYNWSLWKRFRSAAAKVERSVPASTATAPSQAMSGRGPLMDES